MKIFLLLADNVLNFSRINLENFVRDESFSFWRDLAKSAQRLGKLTLGTEERVIRIISPLCGTC